MAEGKIKQRSDSDLQIGLEVNCIQPDLSRGYIPINYDRLAISEELLLLQLRSTWKHSLDWEQLKSLMLVAEKRELLGTKRTHATYRTPRKSQPLKISTHSQILGTFPKESFSA